MIEISCDLLKYKNVDRKDFATHFIYKFHPTFLSFLKILNQKKKIMPVMGNKFI